jgi:hypothetical protein
VKVWIFHGEEPSASRRGSTYSTGS